MNHPSPNRSLHLGIRESEMSNKPYAKFWSPRMAPLPEHAREALLRGPVAAPLLLRLSDAPRLLDPGDLEVENGTGRLDDGALHVAIRTDMPGVSPEMIDWWFGWHGSEAQRYKLWHPRAHVHAAWASPVPPGTRGRARYVGRVSYVDEYIGDRMSHVAIAFLPPRELGFDEQSLSDPRESTAVCARIRLTDYPVDAGYLIHHVRRVPGGSEMRSRFWLGGSAATLRAGGPLRGIATRAVRLVATPGLAMARDLLVHCAEEMGHLASFLPRLHEELRDME